MDRSSGQDRYTTEVVVNVGGTMQSWVVVRVVALLQVAISVVVSAGRLGSASAAAGWQSVQRRRQSRPQQSAPAAPSNEPPMDLMTIFRSDLSLKQ